MRQRCPSCKRLITRSTEANRRLWALYHAMADGLHPGGQFYSAETWHTYHKSRWLGCTDYTLPNGRTLSIPNSTAALDVAEFDRYMMQVEAWANERGVFLEDREDAA